MDSTKIPIRFRPIASMILVSSLFVASPSLHAELGLGREKNNETQVSQNGNVRTSGLASSANNNAGATFDFGSLIPLFGPSSDNGRPQPLTVPTSDGGQQTLYFSGVIPLFSGEDGNGKGLALFINEEGNYFGGVIPIFKPVRSTVARNQQQNQLSSSKIATTSARVPYASNTSTGTGRGNTTSASSAPYTNTQSATASNDKAPVNNSSGGVNNVSVEKPSTSYITSNDRGTNDATTPTTIAGNSRSDLDSSPSSLSSGTDNDAYYDQMASVFTPPSDGQTSGNAGNNDTSQSGLIQSSSTEETSSNVGGGYTDPGESMAGKAGASTSLATTASSTTAPQKPSIESGSSRSGSSRSGILASATNAGSSQPSSQTTAPVSVIGTSSTDTESVSGNAPSQTNTSSGTGYTANHSTNSQPSRGSTTTAASGYIDTASRRRSTTTAVPSSESASNAMADRMASLQANMQEQLGNVEAALQEGSNPWNHGIEVPQEAQTSTISSSGGAKPHASLCISAQDIIDYQSRSDGYINGVNKSWTWSHAAWASSAKPGYDNQPSWVRSQFAWLRDVPMSKWTLMMPWYVAGTMDGDNSGAAVEIGEMSVQYLSEEKRRWITLGTNMKASGGTYAAGSSGAGTPSTTTTEEMRIPPGQFAHGWFSFVNMPEAKEIRAVSIAFRVRSKTNKNVLVEAGADYYPEDWKQRLGEGPLMPGLGTSAPRLVGPDWTTIVFTTLSTQTADGSGVSPEELKAQRPHCS